jgi:hypothetical protein
MPLVDPVTMALRPARARPACAEVCLCCSFMVFVLPIVRAPRAYS